MIVRFFKTGKSGGEAPVNYLLCMNDHSGKTRTHRPEILQGSASLTIDVINSITRQHKYASGCLAFRATEQPSKVELQKIIEDFKVVCSPGLSPDQCNSLFVLHRDPPDKATGQSAFHVHFVMPMTLLSGVTASGKNVTGRRWNPHPPGQQSIETMSLFTAITNHEHGWGQVTPRPLRISLNSFWRKCSDMSKTQKVDLLRAEVSKRIKSGEVNSRKELCKFFDRSLGLEVTREGADYLSVKFPGDSKAVRLKGPMFDSTADYATMRFASSQSHGTEKLSVPAYEQAKSRLKALSRTRSSQNYQCKRMSKKTTTEEKGSNYGKLGNTYGGGHDGGHVHARFNSVSVSASGMERELFQPGQGQWRNGNERNAQEGHGRPRQAEKPDQHVSNASSRSTRSRRGFFAGGNGNTYGTTIETQIWELAIQLNNCEPSQSASIVARLNYLQGVRSRQEGLGQKPKF